MTWLTVPSYRWTASIMCSRTGSRSLRASSGSRSASSSIEPLRSAKRTVTCLRSPSRALLEVRIFSARWLGVYACGELNFGSARVVNGTSDLPQPPQNLSLPSFEKPHDGHVEANDKPHSPQNRRPSRFSAWQRGHCMPGPPSEPGPERSDRWRELSWLAGPGQEMLKAAHPAHQGDGQSARGVTARGGG